MSYGVNNNVRRVTNIRTIKSRTNIDMSNQRDTIESPFSQDSLYRIQDLKAFGTYFYSLYHAVPNIKNHFLMTGEQFALSWHRKLGDSRKPTVIYLVESNKDLENDFFEQAGKMYKDLTFDMEETIIHKKQMTGCTGKWYSKVGGMVFYATSLDKNGVIRRMEYVHEQVNFYNGQLFITKMAEECIRNKRLMLVDSKRPVDMVKMNKLIEEEGWAPVGNALFFQPSTHKIV